MPIWYMYGQSASDVGEARPLDYVGYASMNETVALGRISKTDAVTVQPPSPQWQENKNKGLLFPLETAGSELQVTPANAGVILADTDTDSRKSVAMRLEPDGETGEVGRLTAEMISTGLAALGAPASKVAAVYVTIHDIDPDEDTPPNPLLQRHRDNAAELDKMVAEVLVVHNCETETNQSTGARHVDFIINARGQIGLAWPITPQ
ncbi:hypothetical protein ACGFX8_36730 [Streptomyces sp. NPDC048362]|uniref:hypothetical protein n=1 Tax=Streptomyces sp. NPDC048362 TaxID=3365539 RepID=UPI00371532B9